jgi:hypothetical protein
VAELDGVFRIATETFVASRTNEDCHQNSFIVSLLSPQLAELTCRPNALLNAASFSIGPGSRASRVPRSRGAERAYVAVPRPK